MSIDHNSDAHFVFAFPTAALGIYNEKSEALRASLFIGV